MSLLKPRLHFKPFLYPDAINKFWQKQQESHWLPSEINLSSDVQDWNVKLTEPEKKLIGQILKGFTSSEVIIQDFWSQVVSRKFKHPEIQFMAASFSNMETIHAISYSLLEATLGIEDYEGFLKDPIAKAKIDRLLDAGKNKSDLALALANFSAFTEGVSLFSSFIVLMSFSRFNKMKGLSQIIQFSALDENLHSKAGCWLFNCLIKENPELFTQEMKSKIYEAAKLCVKLEHDFIDQAFSGGEIEGINSNQIKNYINNRANQKLKEINLKNKFEVNFDLLKETDWFEHIIFGTSHSDFFSVRVNDYAKSKITTENIF
jgi:ribonucleoside-diphosphate reductase beta chain